MELKHQLQPYLRQLRLSGVLETLEARHRQAVDGKWSYVEFLSRLLEDEVERRAQKQLALRLRRAAPGRRGPAAVQPATGASPDRRRFLTGLAGFGLLTAAGCESTRGI